MSFVRLSVASERRPSRREIKCEGLQYVRRLVKHHADVVAAQLHSVTLAVVEEVKNLRSQVSRSALCCLRDMFQCLGRQMDPVSSQVSASSLQGDAERGFQGFFFFFFGGGGGGG